MASLSRLENIISDDEKYAYASVGEYAATGTYDGSAAPRYAEPEPIDYPASIPVEEPLSLPGERVRTAPREHVGSQISFVSVIGVFVILGLLCMLVYQYVMLLEETNKVYSTGKSTTEIGLAAQLENLKAEEEKLIAQFENTFGFEYVQDKAVEMFDMVMGSPSGAAVTTEDKAYITAEALTLGPDDILSQIINILDF